MDTKEINATYQWTLDEFVAANALHRRAWPQRSGRGRVAAALNSRGFLFLTLLPLWGLLIYFVLSQPGFGFSDILVFVMIVVSGFFLLFGPRFMRPDRSVDFKRRPDQDQMVDFVFTPYEIEVRSQTATSRTAWGELVMVARGQGGFLFYPTESVFQWLPAHALAANDIDALEQMMRDKVRKYITLPR